MNNLRSIDNRIISHFKNFKQALILLGARQVGKTTLLKRLYPNAKYFLVDETPTRKILELYDSASYKLLFGEAKQIILDELHLLNNPGRAVKIIYDQIPGVQIIVTGSSSLHIKNKTAESMAGRAIYYTLYPLTLREFLSQREIEKNDSISVIDKIITQNSTTTVKIYDYSAILKSILRWGLYPEIIDISNKQEYLQNLSETLIFKDIIELNLIEDKSKALKMLKLLAFQTGNIVNYSELATKIGAKVDTIKRYISIFEQSFIIFQILPFSNNQRDEIVKSPKIYFWDLGLRNALINNFEDIDLRNDSGALFKNLVVSEVLKEISYKRLDYTVNYWRKKGGSEVDLILRNNSEFIGCEIKLHKGSISQAFKNRYPEAKTHVLTLDNIL